MDHKIRARRTKKTKNDPELIKKTQAKIQAGVANMQKAKMEITKILKGVKEGAPSYDFVHSKIGDATPKIESAIKHYEDIEDCRYIH